MKNNKYYNKSLILSEYMNKLIKEHKISIYCLLVLNFIEYISFIDKDDKVCARCIADNTGIYPKSIYKYLNELESVGIIVKYDDKHVYEYAINNIYRK